MNFAKHPASSLGNSGSFRWAVLQRFRRILTFYTHCHGETGIPLPIRMERGRG